MRPFFTNRYRHIKRYREIINVLSKHGFGQLLSFLGLKELPFPRRKGNGKLPLRPAQRVRMIMEELGPTFIKLGQILSTRPDLLPPEYLAQLELLQDRVPPVDFVEIQATLEKELKLPLSEVFSNLEETPLASASIGQVHKGFLTTGEQVVVKVQRAGVESRVETDIEIIHDIAVFLESRTEWGKLYKLTEMVRDFARTIREELDYTFEARNAARFAENFQNDPSVHIPKIYWEHSGRRVLVMEYLQGIKVSEQEQWEQAGLDKQAAARKIAGALLRQIFLDGFFHADPHPGNILVSSGGAVCFLDFGMVGRLDAEMKKRLGALLLHLFQQDTRSIARLFLQLGGARQEVDLAELSRDLHYLVDKYYSRSFQEIKLGETLRELLNLSFTYRISMPVEAILVIRSLVLLESVVERLDPRTGLMEILSPFIKKLLQESLAPEEVAKNAVNDLVEFFHLSRQLPRRMDELLFTVEKGRFKINLEHEKLGHYVNRLNLAGNRLAFSLVVAALIVGSALFARFRPDSFLCRLPLAEVGLIAAVVMGIWLLVSIVRSGMF